MKPHLILLLTFAGVGFSQRFNVRTFTNDDGLPQIQPLSLYQSRSGILWVATYAGLTSYDGTSWSTWSRHSGLPTAQIFALCEDKYGAILIGYEKNGLWRLNTKSGPKPTTLNEETIESLAVDGENNVWIGTPNGLFYDDGTQIRNIIQDRAVRKIIRAGDGMWVAFNNNIAHFSDHQKEPSYIHDARMEDGILFLASFGTDTILVGVYEGMISIGTETTWIPYPADVPRPNLALDDGRGMCWVGTNVRGLIGWNGQNWFPLGMAQGLPDARVRALEADREGNLWIGTDSGLARFSPAPFSVYDESTGLPNPFVRSLFTDNQGTLWAGTRRGPAYLEGNQFVPLDAELFPDPLIFDIDQDKQGRMYFANRSGFTIYESGKTEYYDRSRGLPTDTMVCLLVDHKDRIWLGGNGLFEWREGQFIAHLQEQLSDLSVITMKASGDGKIWVGSSRGPFLYDPETRSVTSFEAEIPTTIWSIDVADDGSTWFATNGLGAANYTADNGFTFIDETTGLPNEFTWQVLSHQGAIWIAHSMGISKLKENEWTHFDTDDGIAELEGSATACLVDSKGNLWFGSGKGVSKYSPDVVFENKTPPGIHIRSIECSSPNLNELDRDFGQLTFRYSAIRLAGPTQYRYRLIGLSDVWSEITDQRAVTFGSLGPGTYQFEVQSITHDGLASLVPASHRFKVMPSMWETWPFRFMVFLSGILLILGLFRFGLYRSKKRRLELERLVGQRTRALQRANQELIHLQEQLVESAHHSGMAETARQFLHLAGNTLNSMSVAIYAIRDYLKDKAELQMIDKFKSLFSEPLSEQVIDRLPQAFDEYSSLKKRRRQATEDELKTLEAGMQSLAKVVRDQEEMASTEAAKESIDLATKLRDMIEHPPRWLVELDAEIELNIGKDLPQVTAPRVVLTRVIRELLRNAVDAIDAAGGPQRCIRIGAQQEGVQMVITIQDSGIGLDPGEVDIAFNYGYSTKVKGSGFGLHYCANAIREIGGHLTLTSRGRGQGATSTITLPLQESPQVALSGR